MSNARQLAALAVQQTAFKNRFINGGCLVSQRGVVAVAVPWSYGGADRIAACVAGATGLAGNILKGAMGGAVTGYGQFIQSATFTAGQPAFCQRVESVNAFDLAGKQVTISGKFFQDTGASQTLQIRIFRGNSVDSAYGTLVGAANTSNVIPSGVTTPFSATFPIDATTAANGFEVQVLLLNAVTVANKNFAIGDFQCEVGTVATAPEFRPHQVEMAMCQRYFEVGFCDVLQTAQGSGQNMGGSVNFKVAKRVTPTMVLNRTYTFQTSATSGTTGISIHGFTSVAQSTAVGGCEYADNWTANAEL